MLARARWSGPWWSPSTSRRTRIFHRAADAQAFARRMTERGYAVELEYADRPVRFTPADPAASS